MQLDDALSKAAQHGMSLTVFTFRSQDGYDGEQSDVDAAYAAAAQPVKTTTPGTDTLSDSQVSELRSKLAESEQRSHALAAQVADLQKQVATAAGGDSAALIAQANTRIAELEAQLAQVPAPAAGNGNGTVTEPGASLASFENYPQSVLGLSDKAQKGINRVEAKTVGDVKAALLSGKLGGKDKGDGRLGRLEVIEVANKLLGQVPSAVGAQPPAQGGGGGGMAGVPTGLTIKSWSELLDSARRKEAAATGEREKIEKGRATLQGLKAQQLTPDIQQQIQQWEALLTNADKMHALYEAQVSQFLYTLGLPYMLKEVRTVNGSLEKAGLHHLVNEAPAPQPAPTA